MNAPTSSSRSLSLAVLLVSLAALALQILMLRLFAIRWWHHFAHLVIGTGLLGFGASGTVLALTRGRLLPQASTWLAFFSFLFAVSAAVALPLSARVGFEPVRLPVDWQIHAMLLHMGVVFLPFLCAGLVVGLALQVAGPTTPRIYFFNLLGSGLGAPLATGGLFLWEPGHLAVGFGALGLCAGATFLREFRSPRLRVGMALAGGVVWATAVAASTRGPSPPPSEYKDLARVLAFPGARVTDRRTSPFGRVEVVASDAIREAPGLSLTAVETLPRQRQIFVDGNSVGVVTHLEREPRDLGHLGKMLSSLAFRLRAGGAALILGAAGGSEVLAGLHAGMRVDALELNPDIVELMRGPLAAFSGNLYGRPDVTLFVGEARGHLRRHPDRYDLIVLPPGDAFGSSSVVGFAPGEHLLYTTESFCDALEHLTPNGVFAVSRWIRQPAREEIRMIVGVIAALEKHGIQDPARHLLIARDWSQIIVLAKREPWTSEEVQTADVFLEERFFDWVYHASLEGHEVNRRHQLPEPIYAMATRSLLGRSREPFLSDYPFDVSAVDDDRPFFFHTRKRGSEDVLRRELGGGVVPLGDWSSLLLRWSTIQAIGFAFLLLIVPLGLATLFRRHRSAAGATPRPQPWAAFLFFAALGFGYLTLEIALLQRLTLFLAQPIFATTMVLTFLLVGSGLGSLTAGRARKTPRTVRRALGAIVVLSVVYTLFLPQFLEPFRGLAAIWRWGIAAVLIIPLAFGMGFPFPLALRTLHTRAPAAIPWAWGINGFASVLASALASLVALRFGYTAVGFVGAGAYVVAYLSRGHNVGGAKGEIDCVVTDHAPRLQA